MSTLRDLQASRDATSLKWKQRLSIVAGALLLLAALFGYYLYEGQLTERSTQLGSVPRIEIARFWPLFSGQMAIKYGARVNNGQPETADSGPIYLIDVRPAASYDEEHIRGAMSMPEPDLTAHISSVVRAAPSNAIIVLYCA